MTETELNNILNHLLSLPGETEVVEFKEAKEGFDFGKTGKYFSALSNETNLSHKPFGWLIFGVQDNNHQIVGSNFRASRKDLDNLKSEIAQLTTNKITFIEIYELSTQYGRVVMLQIPAAPIGIPVAFKGHYYGRDGESLVALNIEEQERIRNSIAEDWSALVINTATINDLDEKAIEVARLNYASKYPDKANEIKIWDIITFLNKAKINKRFYKEIVIKILIINYL